MLVLFCLLRRRAPPLTTTPSTSGRRSTSSCTSPTISLPFPYPLLFSHAPSPHPANWIQAAHLNGVPILGTFIVEGNNDQLLYQLLTGPDPSPHNPKFTLPPPFTLDSIPSSRTGSPRSANRPTSTAIS